MNIELFKKFKLDMSLFLEERDFSNIELVDLDDKKESFEDLEVGHRAIDSAITIAKIPTDYEKSSLITKWVIKFIAALKNSSVRSEVAKALLPSEVEHGSIIGLGDDGRRSIKGDVGSKILFNLFCWFMENKESQQKALAFNKKFINYLMQGASDEQILTAKKSIPSFKKMLTTSNIVPIAGKVQQKSDVNSFLGSLAGFVVEWFYQNKQTIEESRFYNFFEEESLRDIIRSIINDM